MRGWVYVISNKAMPGLIKVGFTLKDPDLRAKELDNTGAPYSYVVEYEVMVKNPRDIEQRVHSALSHAREAKEWFNCELQEAIEAIRLTAGDFIIFENIRNKSFFIKNEPGGCSNRSGAKEDFAQEFEAKSIAKKRMRSTATYSANCEVCGTDFTCTLTRYENIAQCPECAHPNDATEFQEKEFRQS